MKKDKNRSSIINSCEFEGLASFENIDSYELIKQVGQYGKKTIKIESRKDKSKTTKEKEEKPQRKKEKRKKPPGNNTKNEDENRNKRKRENNEEIQNIKKCKSDSIDIKSWESIFVPGVILEAIKELGFKEPSLIQKLAIPAAIKGRKDILGAAETGSGKTLAFMIPIIYGILKNREEEKKNPQRRKDEEDSREEEMVDVEEEDQDESGEEMNDEEEGDQEESGEEMNDEEEGDQEESGEEMNDEEEGDQEESGEEMNDEEEGDQEENGSCVKVIDNANFDFLDDTKIQNQSEGALRALIITPTRELAIQVKKHTDAVLTKTDIQTAVVIGGLSQEKQKRVLNGRPEIVIGTPGRLWEMIEQEHPHLSQLSSVRYLVIDETDRMLEKGHFEELQYILEHMNCDQESRKQRQNFIFSATLTLSHEAPKRFGKKKNLKKVSSELKIENFVKMVGLNSKPKVIDITRKFGTAESLTEAKVLCEKDEKDAYLYYFLKRFPGRTLIFCNSISCVKRLGNVLAALQCKPQSLHASKQQKQRLKSLERFTSNSLSVLLATDVAARGIDIPGVKHIIHYEVPPTAETYIHRSGRTARANQEGVSVLLIDTEEINKYRKLCVTLNRASDLPSFPIDQDTLDNVKERVELAREIEVMQHRVSKKSKEDLWLKKMQSELEIEDNSDIDDDDDDAVSELALRKKKSNQELRMKQAQLAQLLSRPLISSSFSGRYPTASGKLMLPQEYLFNSSSEGAIDLIKEKKTEVNLLPNSNQTKKQKVKRKRKFYKK